MGLENQLTKQEPPACQIPPQPRLGAKPSCSTFISHLLENESNNIVRNTQAISCICTFWYSDINCLVTFDLYGFELRHLMLKLLHDDETPDVIDSSCLRVRNMSFLIKFFSKREGPYSYVCGVPLKKPCQMYTKSREKLTVPNLVNFPACCMQC